MNGLPNAWFTDASDGQHKFEGAPLSPSLDDIFKSDGDVSGGENARDYTAGYHGLGQVRAVACTGGHVTCRHVVDTNLTWHVAQGLTFRHEPGSYQPYSLPPRDLSAPAQPQHSRYTSAQQQPQQRLSAPQSIPAAPRSSAGPSAAGARPLSSSAGPGGLLSSSGGGGGAYSHLLLPSPSAGAGGSGGYNDLLRCSSAGAPGGLLVHSISTGALPDTGDYG